jgi:hypothetical protein
LARHGIPLIAALLFLVASRSAVCATGVCLATLKKRDNIEQKDIASLTVSPDGKLIAVGEYKGSIRLHPTPEVKK